jgi:WD40 repeat protein
MIHPIPISQFFFIPIKFTIKSKIKIVSDCGLFSREIMAHENPIRNLDMDFYGKVIVTASDQGTKLRIWDVVTGEKLGEVRYSISASIIKSLAIDLSTSMLAACDETDRAKVFWLSGLVDQSMTSEPKKRNFFKKLFSGAKDPKITKLLTPNKDERITSINFDKDSSHFICITTGAIAYRVSKSQITGDGQKIKMNVPFDLLKMNPMLNFAKANPSK